MENGQLKIENVCGAYQRTAGTICAHRQLSTFNFQLTNSTS